MILPLYKRLNTFAYFVRWLNKSVSEYHGHVRLRVVIFRDKTNEYLTSDEYVFKMLDALSDRLRIEVFPMIGEFSRSKAIERGLEGLCPDSLVLLMDVDVHLTADFLHRVSLNTKRGIQAYFPVVFTQYRPHILCSGKADCHGNKTNFNFGQDDGIWRSFGYGIAASYKSDVIKVGGFNTLIKGWGKENVDFFYKCIKNGLRIFRSVDPGLLHVYHDKVCDVRLPRD